MHAACAEPLHVRDQMGGATKKPRDVCPRVERDSEEIRAIMARFFARELLAVTNNGKKAVATHELPLARIKRIMKQDSCVPQPRMISADAIPMMAHAATLLVRLISHIAWEVSTKPAQRNTLQHKDIIAALESASQFDFLIDIIDMFDESEV